MPHEKVSIGARIPKDLYNKCLRDYGSITSAIIIGLESLYKENVNDVKQTVSDIKQITDNVKQPVNDSQLREEQDLMIQGLQEQLTFKAQQYESRVKDLQKHNETLVKELEDLKDKEPGNKEILQLQNIRMQDLQEQLKINDTHQQSRVDDLKAQIQNLQDQLKIKDEQIEKKDSQINNLTTITSYQLSHTNQKAIEAPRNKRPWWRFW